MTQKERQDYYLKAMQNSKVQLERAVFAIWKRQTEDEKIQETVNHHNNKGFRTTDGKYLTSFGNWINKRTDGGRKIEVFGHCLSEKQTAVARRRMEKYAGQLVKIYKEKETADKMNKPGQHTILGCCGSTINFDNDGHMRDL
jgi:5-methylcytosine-specific restriction endonuclease McrBC regulatory subunit McrC